MAESLGSRVARRVVPVLVAVAVGLPTSVAVAPPSTAQTPPEPTGRMAVLDRWEEGGSAVRRAAELALAGTDEDIDAFFAEHLEAAKAADTRAKVEEYVGGGGPGLREAAARVLGGTPAEIDAFLASGWRAPWRDDLRVRVMQALATGGPGVREAAAKAMSIGDDEDLLEFLYEQRPVQQAHDNRVRVNQLMTAGGPEVRRLGGAALSGTDDDIAEFLEYGWEVAAARDQEVATVAQLTEQAVEAGRRAREQTLIAREAAANAVEAARLAKEAALTAMAHTEAAGDEADRAANAAGRAADAANRAAATAQTAIAAAAAANSAARQAAVAAGRAAHAAAMASQRASLARAAAASAALHEGNAAAANDAAQKAEEAARMAEAARDSVDQAINAVNGAVDAALAAGGAAGDAAAAARAAMDADRFAGQAGARAGEARAAAARAQRMAGEATRAANATVAIAREAAAAAADARDAAGRAALHAMAAAAAAREAARQAGNAAVAEKTARDAATEADRAAGEAEAASSQAHQVAEIARRADEERLAQRNSKEVADATEASAGYAEAQADHQWMASEEAGLAADTDELLAAARQPDADPALVVANGRTVAVRLLTRAGPWAVAAAKLALLGDDDAVTAFVTIELDRGQERDDRESVAAIADGANKAELRDAAIAALDGDANVVKEFVRSRMYPGRDDDYRVRVMQLLSTGGDGVRAAAAAALNSGSMDQIIEFLRNGQYNARIEDNRVEIIRLLDPNRPGGREGDEVRAAANAVLAAPPTWMSEFLGVDLHKARRRDAQAAAHEATIDALLARADEAARDARRDAFEAAASAAIARDARAEADHWAGVARDFAAQADVYANQARGHADDAQRSADKAAASARTAREAQARAQRDAMSATRFANQAAVSAQSARASASAAHRYADDAFASAVRAGQSALQARDAANNAMKTAFDKYQIEEKRRLASLTVIDPTDPTVPEELRKQCEDTMTNRALSRYTERPKGAPFSQNGGPNGSPQWCLKDVIDGYQERAAKALATIDGMSPDQLIKGFSIFFENANRDLDKLRKVRPFIELAGIIPVAGDFLDATLCLWDITTQKDLTQIGTSCVAIIPMVGSGATMGLRWGPDALRWVDELAAAGNAGCSFGGTTTRVRMADGSSKPIADVVRGDHVLATDPESEETGARRVSATLPHTDQLVTLRTSAGEITSTEDHLYWNETDATWQESQDLDYGDHLRSSNGEEVTSQSLDWTSAHTDVAYDLTVDDLHSYYVVVGERDVLVHNCLINQMAEKYLDELEVAIRVGAKPIEAGSKGFDEMINGGERLKYVVLTDGRVIVHPMEKFGEEIAHPVLSNGAGVKAAGHVDIAGEGGTYFGLFINAESGHFGPGDLNAAKEAFARYGVRF